MTDSALYFIEQFCFMSSRFLLAILVLAGAFWGAAGWCEKTHFNEMNKINEVDISPDRSMLITASDSRNMIVWNFTSLSPLYTLPCTSTVQSAKFSKDGLYIAVGQASAIVNIIQVSTFTSVKNITTAITSVKEVDFSWDNSKLLVCGSNAIEVYYVGGSWGSNGSTTNGGTAFTSCKFQKNNNYFGGDNNGKNTMYIAGTNNVLWTNTQSGPSMSVDFDMVNQSLIVANSGGGKCLYVYPSTRWPTGAGTTQTLSSTLNFAINLNSVAFAKDGSIYAVGLTSYLAIYENNTNSLLFNTSGTGSVISGVFSYDSQYFISGSSTGLVKIFKRNCQACPAGTYELSSTCALCASAMPGCLNCANSTYCYVCGDGYAFDSTNKNCTLCHNSMSGCILCNSTTICTACNSYYYLTGNACTSCQTIANCLTCSGSATCTRCNSNLYLDSTSKLCVACTLTGCLNCYNNTACMNCLTGYYFTAATLTCTRCAIANCTDCNTSTTCQQCVDTYYLTGTYTCVACPANCFTCTSAACSRCQIGYYVSGTGCLPCASPCATCTTAATCTTCIPGYFFASGSCTACSGGCITCTSSTACLSCNVNYYLSGTTCNKCELLLAGCMQCTSSACLRCESGYYFDGTSCLKCAITAGCQTCQSASFCLSCLSGYSLNAATGVCSACGTGCSSCSSSSVCINCLPKYYFSSGSCLQCPAACPTCTSGSSCLSCIQGYYLSGTQTCLSCNAITSCVSCTSNTYCTSCELGYRLSATNTSCVRCSWPCSLCDATQCTECATGYYLATGGVCTICASSCSSCTSSALCTSCVNGYYLTASNTCTSCQTVSAGCSSCTSTTCLTCLTNLGYFLDTGACSLCSSIANCLQCSSATTCTACSFGYYINAGSCSACTNLVSNCQTCTTTTCLACISPYFLSGSACQLCPQGCSTCSSATACGTCLTGYLLQSGLCTYCDTLMNGCEACSSSTVCTECAEGYLVSGSSCASCSSLLVGCQLCSFSAGSNVCSTCMDQYYLSGNSCLRCDTMAGCSQCNSSSVCLSCQTGYYKSAANACTKCADAMCTICTDATTCISCLSGYFVSSGSCATCSSNFPGCVLCNTTQCLQCQSGYYNNAAHQCSSCSVNGCEICNVLQPTQCVTCSSLYYLTATSTCATCNSSMNGCISCSSSTHCLKCMVGSYLTAAFNCQSCFSQFNGCGECTASGCTACQGGYLMGAGSVCSTCISSIPGCLYCTSSTVCLSCQSGYYMSGNNCVSCGGIAGCLDCLGATTCNLCSDTYYLSPTDHLCYICNSTLAGCISCASQTTCKACHGNYALSGGICTALKSTSSEPYEELRLITEYINKDQLLHRLMVKGSFNVQAAVNLTQSSTITMVGSGSTSVQLTIYSYEWISQYEVDFITNNPIGANLSSFFKVMPATRLLFEEGTRLLADSVNLNYQFKLDMTEAAVQAILPTAAHTGSLSLSNPADNPSFIRSVYTQMPYNYHYFGLVVTLLMLVIYVVKATVSVPQSDDQGEIISHVFLLRCGGVIFSLTYMEYMDYCFGFLSADLPWLNLLTASLTASADLSPNSYLLFYPDMTIASSYLSALCLILSLIIILAVIGMFCHEKREGLKVLGIFLFNFFEVGLIMAGSMSIQGAYYNNLNYITSNTIFYVAGIVLFVVVAMACVWMALDSIHRINKVRVLVKTTFLSLLYVSPVYLLPIAMGLELIFIIAEFNVKKAVKLHPHLWLVNQIIVNLALVSLVLLADSKLSLVIPSILVGSALVVDLFIHIREYRHQQQLVKVKEIQKLTNLMETQEKLNRTIKKRNNNIYEKNKMNESGFNNLTQDFLFNALDQDLASSKSPFHNQQQQQGKKEPTYIFDEVSESKEQ